MNYFKELLLNLPCRYDLTADILRKQPRFFPSENLDNSQYVGMRAEVVRPIVCYSVRPDSSGADYTICIPVRADFILLHTGSPEPSDEE